MNYSYSDFRDVGRIHSSCFLQYACHAGGAMASLVGTECADIDPKSLRGGFSFTLVTQQKLMRMTKHHAT